MRLKNVDDLAEGFTQEQCSAHGIDESLKALMMRMIFYTKVDLRNATPGSWKGLERTEKAAEIYRGMYKETGIGDSYQHRSGSMDWILEVVNLDNWDGSYLPLDFCAEVLSVRSMMIRKKLLTYALQNESLNIDHWYAARWRLEAENREWSKEFWDLVEKAYAEQP